MKKKFYEKKIKQLAYFYFIFIKNQRDLINLYNSFVEELLLDSVIFKLVTILYPGPDLNRHEVAFEDFKSLVYQFHHLGFSRSPEYKIAYLFFCCLVVLAPIAFFGTTIKILDDIDSIHTRRLS